MAYSSDAMPDQILSSYPKLDCNDFILSQPDFNDAMLTHVLLMLQV